MYVKNRFDTLLKPGILPTPQEVSTQPFTTITNLGSWEGGSRSQQYNSKSYR